MTITSETDGLTPTPPSEPALSTVVTVWNESAAIVRSAPPEKVAPFSTAARVVRPERMLIAAEAPTPTVPPFASEVASAVSSELLRARQDDVARAGGDRGAAADDSAGLVRDEVERERAGDADVLGARAGLRLRDDLVRGELEEVAARRAPRAACRPSAIAPGDWRSQDEAPSFHL